jgi:hypothetical protein
LWIHWRDVQRVARKLGRWLHFLRIWWRFKQCFSTRFRRKAVNFCWIYAYTQMFSQSWHINAHKYGNVARFFNHSCNPNISSHFVRVGNEPFLRIAFYTFREIREYEELTINYGAEWWKLKSDKIKCKCDYKAECEWRGGFCWLLTFLVGCY